MTLSEQCAQRKAERRILKRLVHKFTLAAINARDQRVQDALARLPPHTSLALKRQVIREITNPVKCD